MTALERIKQMEIIASTNEWDMGEHSSEELKRALVGGMQAIKFCLKSIKVWREIALEIDLEQFPQDRIEIELDKEFEERMTKNER